MFSAIWIKKDKIIIYYDDSCLVCSTEINHYKKQLGSEALEFQNISATDFDPESIKIDRSTIEKYFHIKNLYISTLLLQIQS